MQCIRLRPDHAGAVIRVSSFRTDGKDRGNGFHARHLDLSYGRPGPARGLRPGICARPRIARYCYLRIYGIPRQRDLLAFRAGQEMGPGTPRVPGRPELTAAPESLTRGSGAAIAFGHM
jgi:hypothetical protein